jgi:hypothetical protein
VPYEKYIFTGKLTDGLCYTALVARTFEVVVITAGKKYIKR